MEIERQREREQTTEQTQIQNNTLYIPRAQRAPFIQALTIGLTQVLIVLDRS